MIARDRLRWNGWGKLGEAPVFAPARRDALLAELGRRLGREIAPAPDPTALEEIALPACRIPSDRLGALRAACGAEGVRTSTLERIRHAAGRSLPDLLRLRRGEFPCTPDVVVYPRDEGAVAAVLRVAADARLAVVPFGGGSSVVGGVEPRAAEDQTGVISLDTTQLDQLVAVDPTSRTATFQAGIDGPALEQSLAEHGFTLGHFPQSFEHSTLGGWIATRSTGQYSNLYGGIEDLLVAVRVVTPAGVLRTHNVPRSATGPDLNELVLGSEGTLGVIVEATVRVRPAPRHHVEGGLLFRSFEAGVEAVREASRERLPLAMMRLSDASETDLSLLLRRDPARRVDTTAGLLSVTSRMGFRPGERCVLIHAAEGDDPATLRSAMRRMRAIGRRHGGLGVGPGPGRSWRRDRFRTPYLRDWLLDYDVAVDTVETALPWTRVETAHDAILRRLRASLDSHAGGGIAMAHLSHSYADGACLYFTMIYPLDPALAVKQWTAIKRDATDAVIGEGGTLSHHHGVGVDHAAWLGREKSALGVSLLRAARRTADPEGTLNPGKLT